MYRWVICHFVTAILGVFVTTEFTSIPQNCLCILETVGNFSISRLGYIESTRELKGHFLQNCLRQAHREVLTDSLLDI